MADNMKIWAAVQQTDPKFTKKFTRSGGFSGTATNATWLAKRATETFGPMGIGWGITILNESVFDGAPMDQGGYEKLHRVHIKLWYVLDGKRGEIEHFGQTMLVGKNKYGAFTDEEAPKKSLTDAMSKALSLLGFAADVHLGLYDDVKYVNSLKDEQRDLETSATAEFDPTSPRAAIAALPNCTPSDVTKAAKLTDRASLGALYKEVASRGK